MRFLIFVLAPFVILVAVALFMFTLGFCLLCYGINCLLEDPEGDDDAVAVLGDGERNFHETPLGTEAADASSIGDNQLRASALFTKLTVTPKNEKEGGI